MTHVTFQVVEGVDKGRVFRNLATPVTIGREEGNMVRLNDERISRFHAKVQQDQEDVVLTDLESTNGTRVNGAVVQIRRLRHGDCVCVGRTVLLFGSNEEIAARLASLGSVGGTSTMPASAKVKASLLLPGPATVQASALGVPLNEADLEFDLNVKDPVKVTDAGVFIGSRELPPLPKQLTPSQAARLAEILDFLHRGLAQATIDIQAKDDGSQVGLDYVHWQKVLAVQMLLARYVRAVSEPEE